MSISNDEILAELHQWLDAHWNPQYSLREWRNILVDGGWAAPHWPKDYYGRDLTDAQTVLIQKVFAERGVVGSKTVGRSAGKLVAETLLAVGSDDQKHRYLRSILTGEHAWCQLFSEPGSGSDLAGLSTKAELVDKQWLINGQKVWTTSAHHADYGILLARTNWDVPKHQGISCFLINMHQPGVEVRPFQQMNGYSSFNEVFMTDALAAPEDMVKTDGDGWSVATTTLSIERSFFAKARAEVELQRLSDGKIYEEFDEEVRIANEPYVWYPQREGRVDLVLPRAQATGAINDPATRQEIARLIAMSEAASLAAQAAASMRKANHSEVIPAGSIGKLAASAIARQASHVHTMISGATAMQSGSESAEEGMIAETFISVPAISIAGGTDEIQKNVISERVLGMPKDIRTDTGPFQDIKRN